jgi:dTDP-4-dehydrorhamnose reductase
VPPEGVELWGGVECTVNRVYDRYHNQLRRNGHLDRSDDLDRFAAIGLRTLRMPVLWELAGERDGHHDFTRFDPLLARARQLGLRSIVGLVHHGSGPRYTHLLDPEFAPRLALYAAAVSERYPWVEDYTPVNEPLTTARFSALYGHWYPHARSPGAFLRALLGQTRATILAMRAIRVRQPRARLIQTEDIAHVASTPLLAYQAEHENHRRWLSLDLLCGKLDRQHPLYRYVLDTAKVTDDELRWFEDNACPPDIVGVNYYLTSDRYLDEQLTRHPEWSHGGNGKHRYADMHCSALPERGLRGHRAVLQEVWDRYRLPLAITEVHAGCRREDQLRWLNDAFRDATAAQRDGVDLRAVTAWSLLGSFDWNMLVTVEHGAYESGVFDLRAPLPRRTALAEMIHALSANASYDHPVLDGKGWWHRAAPQAPTAKQRPLLITGGTGTLGQALAAACRARGLRFELLDRGALDLCDPRSIDSALGSIRPWGVINAAGYVRVDDAEGERELCMRVNAQAAIDLARACRQAGLRYLTFSSDLVFDGRRSSPYLESSTTSPLNVYGHSKAEAERGVLHEDPGAMVVRTSAFFGPRDAHNFVTRTLSMLARGERVRAAHDAIVSPTYVPHLADACLDLLIDGASGIWHLASAGALSWHELAQRAARAASLDAQRVVPCPSSELKLRAPRPAYSALASERTSMMPSLDEAIASYFVERR